MATERLSLENRVEQLAGELQALTRRVDLLSQQRQSAPAKPVELEDTYPATEEDASEELLSWIGKSSLLQRLSTLCFLLVIALILRTVTDSGLVDLQIGSFVGMVYAASLMLLGWRRYKRNNPLAPIFTICGAVLMFLVVVETHTHFESLPSGPAYILLMLTGFGMATLSYFYNVPAPISIGNLGMCLAGAAIDYPQPFFPYLGVLLLTANFLGYFAARAHKYSWLRWIMLLVTIFMIVTWGMKLGPALLAKEEIPAILAPSFFLPMLALFALTYPVTAFLRIKRVTISRPGRFDLLVPTVSVIWAFPLAQYVTFATGGSTILIGVIGVVAGLAHLLPALWLAKHKQPGALGANAFVFAGTVLIALALPVALANNTVADLPILSALSFGLFFLAASWQNGNVRLASYLLQIYAACALAFLLFTSTPDAHGLGTSWAAALMAALSLLHFQYCRRHPPPAGSAFFTRIDPNDLSAAFLLLTSLLSAFSALRIVSYQFMAFSLPAESLSNAFQSAQSVIINLSAAVLMLFALARHKKELRNIAIMVTVIGAVKVFLYDLVGGMHGLPLVISVFSFGLTTSLESFGLTRWHHYTAPSEDE